MMKLKWLDFCTKEWISLVNYWNNNYNAIKNSLAKFSIPNDRKMLHESSTIIK